MHPRLVRRGPVHPRVPARAWLAALLLATCFSIVSSVQFTHPCSGGCDLFPCDPARVRPRTSIRMVRGTLHTHGAEGVRGPESAAVTAAP